MKVFLLLLLGSIANAQTVAGYNYSGYMGIEIPAVSVTIAMSATASNVISLKGMSLVGIQTPAALTGTALTFQSCTSSAGSTCYPIKTTTSGTSLSYTVTTSSYYAIAPADFEGVQYLKIVSGSSEAAARTLVCTLKGI